jgi:hypothetical protein
VCGAAGDPANGQPARLVDRYEERPGLDAADLEPVVEASRPPLVAQAIRSRSPLPRTRNEPSSGRRSSTSRAASRLPDGVPSVWPARVGSLDVVRRERVRHSYRHLFVHCCYHLIVGLICSLILEASLS